MTDRAIVRFDQRDRRLPLVLRTEGRVFRLKVRQGRHTYVDRACEPLLGSSHAVLEFEPEGHEPTMISIGGRAYRLHRERLYIPEVMSSSEVESLFDFLANTGYEERFLDIAFNSRVYSRLYDLTVNRRSQGMSRVLDLGSGTGVGLDAASAWVCPLSLVGVDVSMGMARISRRRGLPTARTGFDDPLPFRAGCFDAVVMAFVSNFFSDTMPFARILHVLRPGGKLAFNLYRPPKGFREDALRSLSEAGYVGVGFVVETIRSTLTTRDICFVFAQKSRAAAEPDESIDPNLRR